METININNGSSPDRPLTRTCGTMTVHHDLLERYPAFRRNLAEIEQITERRLQSNEVSRQTAAVIKVVVHVVYNNETENVSDDQVKSQVDVLNADFASSNSDRSKTPAVWQNLLTDSGIQFVLADTDPSGNPTNGITRTKTNVNGFGQDDEVKFTAQGGADAWPADRYLNIWVCNMLNSILGYAQFPGGPVETDGVVILFRAFGTLGAAEAPFDKGRTCTHEVGHFLNLRHIWGDTEQCQGTDFVDDTPNQQLPNYGKPDFPHVTCSNGPNGDMFMNYMDYVDDEAMVMFTAEQVARMKATLEGARKSLIQ